MVDWSVCLPNLRGPSVCVLYIVGAIRGIMPAPGNRNENIAPDLMVFFMLNPPSPPSPTVKTTWQGSIAAVLDYRK